MVLFQPTGESFSDEYENAELAVDQWKGETRFHTLNYVAYSISRLKETKDIALSFF